MDFPTPPFPLRTRITCFTSIFAFGGRPLDACWRGGAVGSPVCISASDIGFCLVLQGHGMRLSAWITASSSSLWFRMVLRVGRRAGESHRSGGPATPIRASASSPPERHPERPARAREGRGVGDGDRPASPRTASITAGSNGIRPMTGTSMGRRTPPRPAPARITWDRGPSG